MRTVLVTGGNRGLGLETCKQLAVHGDRVILTSRKRDGATIAQSLGLEHQQLDVTSDESVRALADSLSGRTLDVLVNNAGIALHGFDAEIARRTIDTNYFGALRVTEALMPLLPSNAVVVMVSSGMGELSSVSAERRAELLDPALDIPRLNALMRGFVDDVVHGRHEESGWPSSAYRVSKVGLNALTRILAREHPSMKINAVCPGWVRTALGGDHAPRTVDEGARSIVWAATLGPDGPTGGFFRDGHPVDW